MPVLLLFFLSFVRFQYFFNVALRGIFKNAVNYLFENISMPINHHFIWEEVFEDIEKISGTH